MEILIGEWTLPKLLMLTLNDLNMILNRNYDDLYFPDLRDIKRERNLDIAWVIRRLKERKAELRRRRR